MHRKSPSVFTNTVQLTSVDNHDDQACVLILYNV